MVATTIRPLVLRDLSAVVRIDAVHTGERKPAYWQRLFGEFGCGRAPAPAARQAHRAVRGQQHVALAAERQGRLIGFVFGDIRGFEFGSEPCGWILEIGVDPAVVRGGVASALLAAACRRLRTAGVTTIRTMVRKNNVPVLTFFRTNGFAGGPYVQLELTP